MRKVLALALLVVAGVVLWRRVRSRASALPVASRPTPPPGADARTQDPPQPSDDRRAGVASLLTPDRPTAAAPPPTTNGERVVLMSIWALQERGEDATHEAVVRHVAAGEIDPDEGTVDVLLHRLAGTGCLVGGDDEPYRLTPSGEAALLDGSRARPSPAGDATVELSSPTTEAAPPA